MSTMIENGSARGWPKEIVLYTDGASRGNPGPAAIGVVVQSASGETIYERGRCLGSHTNNVAEYTAVVEALELALSNKVERLTLRSDSELLIRQLKGEYKVRSNGLRPLFERCVRALRLVPSFSLEHVRREYNVRADELGNEALDQNSL
jgi:ribonuclease HI